MLNQIDITKLPIAPSLHWLECYAAWLHFDYIKRGGGELAQKSLSAYLQDARHLSAWFETYEQIPFSPELLTVKNIRAYFDWQEEHKYRPNTRNRRLANLHMLVRWAMSNGWLESDPSLRQTRVRQQRLPRKAKDLIEIRAIEMVVTAGSHLRYHTERYELLGLRDRLIWSLFKNTALRIEMICNLDVADIDLRDNVFRVIAKGDVEQEFPINAELKADIEAWLAVRPGSGPALITDWHGARLTTCQVRRRLDAMGKAAGVKVKPHDMRHTRIEGVMRTALQSGMPAEKALSITQTLAGHADPRTTLTYLRATFAELAAVNAAA